MNKKGRKYLLGNSANKRTIDIDNYGLTTGNIKLVDYVIPYTVFRQAFLLIQYSFICKQYFFCSDREYQYFFDRW